MYIIVIFPISFLCLAATQGLWPGGWKAPPSPVSPPELFPEGAHRGLLLPPAGTQRQALKSFARPRGRGGARGVTSPVCAARHRKLFLSTSVPLFLARPQRWQESAFPVPCCIPGWGWWLAAAVLFVFGVGSGWLWCVTESHSRAAPGWLSLWEDEGPKNPRNGTRRNTRRVFELQTRVGSKLASTS